MTIRVQRLSPDYIVKGIQHTATLTIDDSDEAVITALGGTNVIKYSLYDADGAAVTGVSALTATWTAGSKTASRVIDDSSLSSLTYSDDYHAVWQFYGVDGDGATSVLIQIDVDTMIVRARPFAPLTTADLQRRNSELIGDYALPSGRTSWHDYIDEAFAQLVSRLLATGVGVHEITSWHGFREYVARLAEYMIARDLMVTRSGATKWMELWEVLGGPADDPRSAEWAWSQLGYRIDRDQDGVPDTDAKAESKPGSYYQTTSDSGWRGF
jgi:hypothetical protein